MLKIALASGAPPQTPLGSLRRSPRPPNRYGLLAFGNRRFADVPVLFALGRDPWVECYNLQDATPKQFFIFHETELKEIYIQYTNRPRTANQSVTHGRTDSCKKNENI